MCTIARKMASNDNSISSNVDGEEDWVLLPSNSECVSDSEDSGVVIPSPKRVVALSSADSGSLSLRSVSERTPSMDSFSFASRSPSPALPLVLKSPIASRCSYFGINDFMIYDHLAELKCSVEFDRSLFGGSARNEVRKRSSERAADISEKFSKIKLESELLAAHHVVLKRKQRTEKHLKKHKLRKMDRRHRPQNRALRGKPAMPKRRVRSSRMPKKQTFRRRTNFRKY